MERNRGERAWILHHHPFGDGGLILEVFSEEHGRLGVLARGQRRSGRLEAGRPYWLRWAGRGELPVLQGAEEIASPLTLQPVPALLLFYVNELLLRLTERGDPQPMLFAEMEDTLQALAAEPEAYWRLRRFERRLLEVLGWAADLQRCAECGAALEEGYAQPGSGVFCAAHRRSGAMPLSAAARVWLVGAMQTSPPRGLARELRAYLAAELDQPLAGRALESRRLLAAYLRRDRKRQNGEEMQVR
ncbi:MAG: DNA repair protein RecO [Candidatus Igneacidithiobacillus chanchocoensis]